MHVYICGLRLSRIIKKLFTSFFQQITVTWTSGYGISDAEPFVEWGPKGGNLVKSPAGTLTFDRNTMCGMQLLCYFLVLILPVFESKSYFWDGKSCFLS